MLVAIAAAIAISQVPVTFEGKVTRTVTGRYLAYTPQDYTVDSRKKWPLIMFLHGAGERGSDLNLVKLHGIPKEIEAGRKLPFVVIAPQCDAGQWWDTQNLNLILNDAEKRYRIDKDRIYVTGLSMGGFASWALAMEQPNRFAAIAPVCGGGDVKNVSRIAKLPIWTTHGDKDLAVNVEQTRKFVTALKALGSDIRYDEIKDGGHDVWTDFYKQPALYEWFLKHTRKR